MAQYFYIKKNSTKPILKMKVVNDGRFDYKKLHEELENAAITFSMYDVNKNEYKIYRKQGILIPIDGVQDEYYIGYVFNEKETNKPGLYKIEFKIDFFSDNSSLIVPIRDDVYVNVVDSFITSSINCY
jgi:hypothetical protein